MTFLPSFDRSGVGDLLRRNRPSDPRTAAGGRGADLAFEAAFGFGTAFGFGAALGFGTAFGFAAAFGIGSALGLEAAFGVGIEAPGKGPGSPVTEAFREADAVEAATEAAGEG